MEYRTAQQEIVDSDDDSAELEKRNRLLLDAEKARKEAALAEKRKKARIDVDDAVVAVVVDVVGCGCVCPLC